MGKYRIMLSILKENRMRYILGVFILGMTNPLSNIVVARLLLETFDRAVYDARLILPVAIQFLLLTGFLALMTPLGEYLISVAALRTTGRLREAVLTKLIRLDQTALRESHSGDYISRGTNDVQVVESLYKEQLQQVSGVLLNGIGCSVAMLLLNWRFSLGLMVYQLLMIFLVSRFGKPLKRVSDTVQGMLGKVTEKTADLLGGYEVIRLFNLGDSLTEKFKQQNDQTLHVAEKRVRLSALYQGVNAFSWSSSFVGFIVVSGWFMSQGYVTLGTIIALTQLQNGVSQLFLSLGTYYNELQTSLAGLQRVQDLLDKREEPEQYPLALRDCQDESALTLHNVSFSYQGSVPVLRNLDLSIAQGETVAIVGPSGGGKSTLFRLLLGFNFPQEGCLSLLGRPASDYSLGEIREIFAYVPQDPYLFSGTIGENIAYGKLHASDADIQAAAKRAHAHHFIERLPQGYDTKVGERGVFLSGGEKQRIAIARAILRDAEILLLDEATSSLDNESEALVQAALEDLMQERTSLVIAHRLSTVEKADRILVLDQGVIVEEGTHEGLLSQGGLYARLHAMQFRQTPTQELAI